MTEEKTKERTLIGFYRYLKHAHPRKVRVSSRTHEAYYRNPPGENAMEIIRGVEIEEDDSLPFGEWKEEY